MIPTSFDESNLALSKPDCMSHDECEPLSVWAGHVDDRPAIISCWKITQEELEEFKRTGRIWLWIYGNAMPPVALSVKRPFHENKEL